MTNAISETENAFKCWFRCKIMWISEYNLEADFSILNSRIPWRPRNQTGAHSIQFNSIKFQVQRHFIRQHISPKRCFALDKYCPFINIIPYGWFVISKRLMRTVQFSSFVYFIDLIVESSWFEMAIIHALISAITFNKINRSMVIVEMKKTGAAINEEWTHIKSVRKKKHYRSAISERQSTEGTAKKWDCREIDLSIWLNETI